MKVMGHLTQVLTDPSQYKIYSPVINFYGVAVEFEIDDKYVTKTEDGQVVLSLDGLMAILWQEANAIDRMHYDRQNKRGIAR